MEQTHTLTHLYTENTASHIHSQPLGRREGMREIFIKKDFFFLLLNTELTCYILHGVSMRFRLPLVFYANQQSSGTLMKQTTCIYNSLLLFSQSLAALLTQLMDCMHFPPHGELLNPQGTIALKSLEDPSFNHSIRIKPHYIIWTHTRLLLYRHAYTHTVQRAENQLNTMKIVQTFSLHSYTVHVIAGTDFHLCIALLPPIGREHCTSTSYSS